MAVLVERATSDLLAGPDWGLNLQICDAINQNNSYPRDVVKCIKKRLSSKSAKVQILTLTVLEMIIKNCGESVHQQVAEKGVLKSMVKIVKGKGDAIVREKILTLLKAWQMMFGGPKAKYPQYSSAYEGLLRSGVQFPVEDTIDTALLFAPAKQPSRVEPTEILLSVPHATVSSPQIVYGLSSSIRPARVAEVLAASENFHWSAKDLDAARECVEVLNEMLNALDPKDKQAVCSDVIVQLIEQCETNKKIVRQLVTSTSDESLLFQGLSLNDDLQQVLARFKLLSTSSSPVAEEVHKSSSGELVHDQDDETEGEVSQLTHRWSSMPGSSSASSLETGFPGSMEYHSSEHSTSSTSSSYQAAIDIDGASPSKSISFPDDDSNLVNPFANMASISTGASGYSSLRTANGPAFVPSDLGSNASHPQQIFERTNMSKKDTSVDLCHCDQDFEHSLPQEYMQVNGNIRFDHGNDKGDMVFPFSSMPPQSPVLGKKLSSNLPPPPKLHSMRERFFEEKRHVNQSPRFDSTILSSAEGRPTDFEYSVLNNDGKNTSMRSLPAAKPDAIYLRKSSRPEDHLFEDLVDFKSMKNKA